MLRRVLAVAGTIAIIAVGCATKVGDRKPTTFTSFDPERPVLDLTQSEAIRMCLDAKKILTDNEKFAARCAITSVLAAISWKTGVIDPALCHSAHDECVRRGPSEALDVSDCHKFALDARGCGALTIGDLNQCLVARGGLAAALARAGAGICDQARTSTTDTLESSDEDCSKTDKACAVGQVDLF
jgi:hypothetical protein